MAKMIFRPKTVKALAALSKKLGISKEDTVNNAILVYHDMIFNEHKSEAASAFDDLFNSTGFGRQMKRRKRQEEIIQEERDIAFHKEHNRPYTPIR